MLRIPNVERVVSAGQWLPGRALAAVMFLFALALPVRAGAVELRVTDPLRPIYDVESARAAPSGDELLLTVPRNGTASAQVVIIGEGAGGLRAEMGPLSSADAELPPDAVEIRYAWRDEDDQIRLRGPAGSPPDSDDKELFRFYGDNIDNIEEPYYDRLNAEPRPGAELVPVWVSVRVPAGAEAGRYTGQLAVGDAAVPVRVKVSEWVCPDPIDFTTHVGVRPMNRYVQEGKWDKVEQQVKFLGALGTNELWLDVKVGGSGGSGDPVIQFTREGGELRPDLSHAERYIDLFAEHVGRPTYVIFDYWSSNICPVANRDPDPLHVLVDGEREAVPLPEDGGERLWGAAIGMLADLLQERGWSPESIRLAMGGDRRPSGETVGTWRHLAPYASWMLSTHGPGDRPLNTFGADEPIVQHGMEIGYYSLPYMPGYRQNPTFLGGWTLTHSVYSSGRNIVRKYKAPSQWRSFPNGMMIGHPDDRQPSAGFAGLFMDNWERRGGWNTTMGFLVHNNSPSFIERDSDGLVPTVRFEMLREGLQEAEARVVIERALAEGEVDEATAAEARELLTKLYNIRYRNGNFRGTDGSLRHFESRNHWGVAEYPRWIELSTQLYDMAARVSNAFH